MFFYESTTNDEDGGCCKRKAHKTQVEMAFVFVNYFLLVVFLSPLFANCEDYYESAESTESFDTQSETIETSLQYNDTSTTSTSTVPTPTTSAPTASAPTGSILTSTTPTASILTSTTPTTSILTSTTPTASILTSTTPTTSIPTSTTQLSTTVQEDDFSFEDPIDIPPAPLDPSTHSTLGAKLFLGCVFASFIIAVAAVGYCVLNVIGLTCYGIVKCVSMRYKPKPTMDLRRDDLNRSLNGDIKLEVLASYDTGVSLA